MITPISITPERKVGPGQPCFLAAEIGLNHNGDMELAKKTIEAAAKAGADGVKFQNYYTEDFISDRSLMYEYISAGKTVSEPQFDMFKRCELNPDDLLMLREFCDSLGVIFFSTPTSERGINDLHTSGVRLLKNGSDYLTHLPLIQAMARTNISTVLSAGMATLAEVDDAVRAFRSAGGQDLILLHCTSSYPTPDEDVHLRKIQTLADAFGCVTGFSDHTDGVVAAIGAVTFGACFIEKHFTLDKSLPGPDHRFSADPIEFAALSQSVRRIEQNIGHAMIGPTPSESYAREIGRLSCVAADALPPDHVLTAADIAFRRPGNGLPPKAAQWLVGRRLTHALQKGTVFKPGDFTT